MAYTSITVEGGIFPADLLDQIAAGDAEGQAAKDFGIDGSRRLPDAIQGAFSDARAYWDAFQRRLARSKESSTTLTREDWMAPFLELLGFEDLVLQRSSVQVGTDSYVISHRAGQDPYSPPVHIVAVDETLDRRNGSRRSPHAVVQEYLNRSDAVWGIVTNGERLRLLRDTARLAKPTYLEFDLQGMLEGNVYSEFVLLYRLLHASRFPRDFASVQDSWLEKYYQQGIEQGGPVREHLRDGVEEALKEIGTAFLRHPESGALRGRFESGSLKEKNYYRQLLRLVYRFLFLMVAEERRLIFPLSEAGTTLQTVYTRYYGIGRLRDRADRYFAGDQHCDLWLGLRETFRLLRDNDAAKKLGLAALNGELFGPGACADLESACCTNEELLRVVRHLSTFVDEETGRRRGGSGQRRRVNYAALDVEEFGSVYESLLDFHPQVTLDPPEFALVTGSERKQTGSYYTPPELVRELIESALVPVMEERLKGKRTKEEKEEALLGMRVCDPASGSGHFLLAAARRIARELARARGGEEEPAPEEYRHALRDVIRHCTYAVDKNPLAVDLCKVALWVEGHNAGLPLSFLDNHIKCGDSLVGVADLSVLEKGIPDDAYKPVTGDDKEAAKHYRNRNKREREGQLSLPVGAAPPDEGRETLAREFDALAQQEEQTPGDVAAKEELYESLRGPGGKWYDLKVACDLWTYAFFAPLRHAGTDHIDHVPTTSDVRGYLLRPNAANGALVGEAVGFSQEMPFFHWPLEFPDVFARGRFDVVLGNPPWERIKLQEEEFFAVRAPEIAAARNKAARQRMINDLARRGDPLAAEFDGAKHAAEAQSKFVRACERFPLTGIGDINTYALFAEQCRMAISGRGRAGIIIPTGIATDTTTKDFFGSLINKGSLVKLLGFINEEMLFPGVLHNFKFCLLSMAGPGENVKTPDFAFLCHSVEHSRQAERHFTLNREDLLILNPNTLTCPVFRTGADCDLTKSIYSRVPVLVDEKSGLNRWGLDLLSMFHMSNDSHLFHVEAGPGRLPLYEGKMIQQYDHRFASYETLQTGERMHMLPETPAFKHADPSYTVKPCYYVSAAEVDSKLAGRTTRQWLVGFRETTSSGLARSVIFSVIPRAAVGGKVTILFVNPKLVGLVPSLLGNFNSLVLDYVARQKIGGADLPFFLLKQFAVLPPEAYSTADVRFIAPRVLELSYIAWDLKPFAEDMGLGGPPFPWDAERRALLRAELDAYYAALYGLTDEELRYVLDPHDVHGEDFPSETFRVLKEREQREFGEYRTRRLVLEAWQQLKRDGLLPAGYSASSNRDGLAETGVT